MVERIIGKKVMGKKVLYKVKWQGYPESESTWEKVSHLRYVSELVESYERERNKGQEKNVVEELLAMGAGSDTSESSDTAEKEASIDKDPVADPKATESKVTVSINSSSQEDDDKPKGPGKPKKDKTKQPMKNTSCILEKSQLEEESARKNQEEERAKKERNKKKEQKRLKILRKMKERESKTIDYPSYCPQEERDSSEEEQPNHVSSNPNPVIFPLLSCKTSASRTKRSRPTKKWT